MYGYSNNVIFVVGVIGQLQSEVGLDRFKVLHQQQQQ